MDRSSRKTAFACALMMFAFAGLTTNGFAVYQPYILSENSFTNTQGSVILTIRNLGSMIAMLSGVILFRKISVRRGVALAGMCAASGFLLFSVARTFTVYCVAGLLIGLSFGAGGMIPLAIVAERGFGKRKTKVLGICAAMTGLSTLGIPFLIVSVTEKYGLRYMFRLEGLFEFAVTLIVYILMKDGAADIVNTVKEESKQNGQFQYSSLNTREIVLFFFIAVFAGAPGFAGITHLSVLCTGEGISTRAAAGAVMASGIALTVSKALYGTVKERVGAHSCQLLYGFLLITGQIMFGMIGKSNAFLFISIIMFSAGLAFLTVGIADWAGTLAPAGKKPEVIQLSQIGYMTGGLLLSSLPGIIADRNCGSYVEAYVIFALFSFFAVILNYIECRKHRIK